MTYLVFHLVGYVKKDQLGNLEDKVVVRLIDDNYDNAFHISRRPGE